jgi:hypothetical protein
MESSWLFGLYKLPVVRQQSQLVIFSPAAFYIFWLIIVGAGVIGDITTSAERGSLVGVFGGGK